jgi:hypothetical protein
MVYFYLKWTPCAENTVVYLAPHLQTGFHMSLIQVTYIGLGTTLQLERPRDLPSYQADSNHRRLMVQQLPTRWRQIELTYLGVLRRKTAWTS